MDQPTDNPFAHVPHSVRGHFLLHFYAAVYRLIGYMYRLNELTGAPWETVLTHYPFIAGYQNEIQRALPPTILWQDDNGWWEECIRNWEAGIDIHLPLRAVEQATGGGFASRIALVLAGLVDEDSRFGTLFADLQAPLPARRLCLETLARLLPAQGHTEARDVWSICQPLLRAQLIALAATEQPRTERVLHVPTLLWDLIRGTADPQPLTWCRFLPPEQFAALPALVLPEEQLRRLVQLPQLLREGQVEVLVLRGMQGVGQLQALGALARALGRGLIHVAPIHPVTPAMNEERRTLLGPMCLLSGAMPALAYDLAPGETVAIEPLPGYAGPIGVLLGQEGGLSGTLLGRALTFVLPAPDAELRTRHWRAVLGPHANTDLAVISERFCFPGEYIQRIGQMAITQAALDQRHSVGLEDVRAASRALNRQMLDSLAARIEATGTWEHLVVSPATRAGLHELELRCRHRERLLGRLGPAFSGANRGVRALFSGGSGTGKTLAARILATELGMDLYRVDLSAIVNKYIGETEKNLHRVLSRAEELDVILLLDEGDSLLGNRTEVKSANDRYANLETNFLLQRLESYQGIILVTTNASQDIDSAFQRRLDVVVNFVPPQADERLRIWQLHLPPDHTLEPRALEQVAARCVLTGGQIRNAALLAALLAVDAGVPLGWPQLVLAVEGEYRKAGALCQLQTNSEPLVRPPGMAALRHVLG